MRKYLMVWLMCCAGIPAYAASPTCHTHSGSNYCQYTGKVSNIYINIDNLILIYFDAGVDVAQANSLGMNISYSNAAAFQVADNPDFAQLFYSTALAAQASGREVTLQMRGSLNGYLKFDRIWLAAP